MRIVSKIFIPLSLIAMVGCKGLLSQFASDNRVVAKVGDVELMESDMQGVCVGVSGDDSVKLADAYVDAWVRKQLKIQTAEEMFSDSEDDIERMVTDYRNSLLNHKLDQYYVNKYLDTLFTASEISDYYNAHQGDFLLDRDIVKGRIVKLPESYRQRVKLKELMGSDSDERQQDFLDLCAKNNFTLIEFVAWSDYSEFLSHLPVSKNKNNDEMLTNRGVQELAFGDDKFLFLINQRRKVGDPIPIERVEESIYRILFNQRKMELLRKYEDGLIDEATKEKKIHIYN